MGVKRPKSLVFLKLTFQFIKISESFPKNKLTNLKILIISKHEKVIVKLFLVGLTVDINTVS